jgi:hypothetical protein
LPFSSLNISYVHFSKTSILSLLRSLKIITSQQEADKDNKCELIDRFFDTKKFVKKNENITFDCFYTDGYTVSVVHTKETSFSSETSSSETYTTNIINNFRKDFNEKKPLKQLISIDPGMVRIFTCHDFNLNEQLKAYSSTSSSSHSSSSLSSSNSFSSSDDDYWVNKFNYPSNEYYNFIKIEKHLNDISVYITDISQKLLSCKTSDIENLKKYISCFNSIYEKIYYYKKNIEKTRQKHFKTFIKKRIYFDNLVNRFRNSIVGIGDWKQSADSKIRRRKGPNQELKNHLRSNGISLIEIKEHRTSITCHSCHNRFEQLNQRMFICSNCKTKNNHRLVIDRDVNASRNMMRCLIALLFGLERPRELQKKKNHQH